MIITCPYCQTKYQVARDAIGAVGRQVQCAHCQKAWDAKPEPEKPAPARRPVLVAEDGKIKPGAQNSDKLFDDIDELGLDKAFAEAEREDVANKFAAEVEEPVEAVAETVTEDPMDQAMARRRQRAYVARQSSLAKQLPYARVRRTARAVALGALILFMVGAFLARTQIVAQFPQLAGIYESLGLGVNVVGLEFGDVTTMRRADKGAEVMRVDATIYSVANSLIAIPPVVVTMLDVNGAPIFEWSITPPVADIAPGETVKVTAEVTAPPAGAKSVRLAFAGNRRLNTTTPASTANPVTADMPAETPVASADAHATAAETHETPAETPAVAADHTNEPEPEVHAPAGETEHH